MKYKSQRPSFDLGKRNNCKTALLQTAKQQTSEVLRPSGQECTVGLHIAITADEANIPKAAAIQQLTAVADQLQMGRQDVGALSLCNHRGFQHLTGVCSAPSCCKTVRRFCIPATATNGTPVEALRISSKRVNLDHDHMRCIAPWFALYEDAASSYSDA